MPPAIGSAAWSELFCVQPADADSSHRVELRKAFARRVRCNMGLDIAAKISFSTPAKRTIQPPLAHLPNFLHTLHRLSNPMPLTGRPAEHLRGPRHAILTSSAIRWFPGRLGPLSRFRLYVI
jgi:hypothetical protein